MPGHSLPPTWEKVLYKACRSIVMEISSQVASAAHVEYHARILAQKYLQRQLIHYAGDIDYFFYDDLENDEADYPRKDFNFKAALDDFILLASPFLMSSTIVLWERRWLSPNDLERNYNKAELELKALADLVVNGKEANIPKGILKTEFTSEFTKDEFEAVVKKTQYYIKEGDIFQCVVSNRREAEFEGSLLNAYRVLRTLNPSPYMFYLSGGDVELTGASPETLVKMTDGKMYTFPIAGTMRRGKNEAEDLAIEEKLINDEKELAEHNMLVDLGRNDLGKISKFGSVKVEALHMLQRFSHVIHITSTVSGDIQDGKDALDAIGATLPAGTLSGAPKIRAIEILHELEKSPRGVYGGAVGYIDFSGNMDVCIGIRMAMNKGGKVYVRAGAGIVRDSIPESEYNETLIKGQSMISAITNAQEVE